MANEKPVGRSDSASQRYQAGRQRDDAESLQRDMQRAMWAVRAGARQRRLSADARAEQAPADEEI